MLNFLQNRQTEEANANTALQDNRPAILRELDEINTADTANEGILGGILNEQAKEQRDREAFEAYRNGGGNEQQGGGSARESKRDTTDAKDFEKYHALNASLQDVNRRAEAAERSNQELKNELRGLRSDLQSRSAQEQQQRAAQPQYNPEDYVQHKDISGTAERVQAAERYIWDQGLRMEGQRAQLEWMAFKQENPNFGVGIDELQQTFQNYVTSNGAHRPDYNRAVSINWRQVFNATHAQQSVPTLREENEKLKKEIESLKTGAGRATNANNRNATPQTQQVSPSLRPTGRAIATVGQSGTNDVIHLKSYQKGKSFKSYAQELKREGHIPT